MRWRIGTGSARSWLWRGGHLDKNFDSWSYAGYPLEVSRMPAALKTACPKCCMARASLVCAEWSRAGRHAVYGRIRSVHYCVCLDG